MKPAALALVAATVFVAAVLTGVWPGRAVPSIAVDAVNMQRPPSERGKAPAPVGQRAVTSTGPDLVSQVARPVGRSEVTDFTGAAVHARTAAEGGIFGGLRGTGRTGAEPAGPAGRRPTEQGRRDPQRDGNGWPGDSSHGSGPGGSGHGDNQGGGSQAGDDRGGSRSDDGRGRGHRWGHGGGHATEDGQAGDGHRGGRRTGRDSGNRGAGGR